MYVLYDKTGQDNIAVPQPLVYSVFFRKAAFQMLAEGRQLTRHEARTE